MDEMNSGSIPASWLTLTGVMDAEQLLKLLERIDERGISHSDLDAIGYVWHELTDGFEFPEMPRLVGAPHVIKRGEVPIEQRWQRWHDDWRNRDRDLRWYGQCIVCTRNVWAFTDGENDPRGPLGDNALWPVSEDDQPPSRTCAICANDFGSYTVAREFMAEHPADEWQALVWPDTDEDVEPVGEITYRIVRRYQDENFDNEVIETGLTLDEARAHCGDPETSSSTATSVEARARTVNFGDWFDTFEAE